jgi:hypothetical protein
MSGMADVRVSWDPPVRIAETDQARPSAEER